MRTAQWSTYTGPGRIMLAKPPANLPRPYRLAPAPFYLGTKRPTSAIVWATFAMSDPAASWRALHALTLPYEPILCSAAAAGDTSYRTMLAEWLSLHLGETITELQDPKTHWPIKLRPTLHGLRPNIWPAEPTEETTPEQV